MERIFEKRGPPISLSAVPFRSNRMIFFVLEQSGRGPARWCAGEVPLLWKSGGVRRVSYARAK
jgi:hypothetical protein